MILFSLAEIININMLPVAQYRLSVLAKHGKMDQHYSDGGGSTLSSLLLKIINIGKINIFSNAKTLCKKKKLKFITSL